MQALNAPLHPYHKLGIFDPDQLNFTDEDKKYPDSSPVPVS